MDPSRHPKWFLWDFRMPESTVKWWMRRISIMGPKRPVWIPMGISTMQYAVYIPDPLSPESWLMSATETTESPATWLMHCWHSPTFSANISLGIHHYPSVFLDLESHWGLGLEWYFTSPDLHVFPLLYSAFFTLYCFFILRSKIWSLIYFTLTFPYLVLG